MQMAIDVAGFTAGRGRPAAPGHGLEAQPRAHGAAAGPALRGHGRAGHHRRGGRRDLRQAGRLRQLRLPREPLGVVRLPRLRAARGSSCYYPAAFCAALLNAQPMGFYSPHSLVQDARRHGVEVRTPDVNASARARDARVVACSASELALERRCRERRDRAAGGAARAARRCAASATTWPSASRPSGWPTGPTPTMEDLERRVPRSSSTCSRRWPPPGRSARWPTPTGRRSTGGGRCGRPARWPRSGADRLAGVVTGVRRADAAGHDRQRGGRRRPVGHRRVARRPSHPVRARRTSTSSAWCRRAGLRDGRRRDQGARRRAWSPTASGRPPRGAPPSSTSRTRPASSTSSARRGAGPATAGWPAASPALLIRGRLEKAEGVINVVAEKLEPLPLGADRRLARLPLTRGLACIDGDDVLHTATFGLGRHLRPAGHQHRRPAAPR